MADVKRGQHHGALREALLEAGLALLDAEGIEAVTIRACARRTGVSHAAPVNHFADRRALLTALAVHCMNQLEAETTQRLSAVGGGAQARLEELFTLSVDYGLAWPHRYRLMGRADLRDALDPALTDALDRLMAHVTGLVAELAPKRVSQPTMILALCAALSGYVFMVIDGNLGARSEAETGRPLHLAMLDLLLD